MLDQKTKPKLLIVDDDELIRNVLSKLLRQEFSIESVDDASKAVDLITDELYDVVLSDIDMPIMTGDEMYFLVKEKNEKMSKRILFMTGGTSRKEAINLLKKVNWVPKPFDTHQLKTLLIEKTKC